MRRVSEPSFFSLLHDFFLCYLPNEKKASSNTIRSYKNAMLLFLDFTKNERGIKLNQITFNMIDKNLLLRFLDYLENERKCSISTRNQRLQCIRSFYAYAATREFLAVVYWEDIKKVESVKTPQTITSHMSEVAVSEILRQPDIATRKGCRDQFLMLLLYQTGARIQELLDIRLKDIRFGRASSVILHGKGGKVRAVPLQDKTEAHLKKYIEIFHANIDSYSQEYLFFVLRNGLRKRMTEDNARKLIYNYGVSARSSCHEVPENVHPHLFRHSRAMHLYQNGVDLNLISQWLGHSNLETTLIYAHADTELKRQAIAKAIPEDDLLKSHLDAERYIVSDEETLALLCGLR